MKGFLLIIAALCVDLLQGAMMLLFTGLGAIPGVGLVSIPIGIGIDILISFVFGGALILLLASMGMFYPGTVLSVFLGESMPVINILPGWTLMTWRSLHKKNQEEKDKRKGFSGAMPGVSLNAVPGREDTAFEKAQWATRRINDSRQVDGIRHA